ncbi:DUF475 domain-containing protein [Phyllobacterium sp. LjRoot231]|uniref:DUF475 domain-containing protein n=1 Tax=Phyllobacterium sp. LjRoot231 TaxID=3342289 RepID=UPI003ED107B2
MATYKYFTWPFAFTIIGLALGTWIGFVYSGSIEGALAVLFICAVLSVLEISLSFDNAIVNAKVLRDMTPVWQRRFLTWGIVIAVFGMRIVFPLAIVAVAAWIDPLSALKLAISDPIEYARIMQDAHIGIAAFGGTFLMMVGLKFFFDREKDVHWIKVIERRASRFASIQGIEVGVVLVLIIFFSRQLEGEESVTFLTSAVYGLLTFLFVEGLGEILDATQEQMDAVQRGGLGAFLYLEVLDASFSFDGVVGAFALSTNLFVIAIGLGIGAFYVRSLTIMLVEKETLGQYRYLEHGAFYAILVLAVIMFCQTLFHIPEVITGLIGAALIFFSLWSSIIYRRRNPEVQTVST